MMTLRPRSAAGGILATALVACATANADPPPAAPSVRELATFAAPGCVGGCGSGSTVGPDGRLYVTDGKTGRVLRVDPTTGSVTAFATGLPPAVAGIGGAIDVA